MNRTTCSIERIYTDSKLTFSEIIHSIINHKIEEIVNNANEVNTTTSQNKSERSDTI